MANSKQSLREPILLDQVDNLYVPQDERTLRRVQRTVEAIDRSTRGWAQTVIDLLLAHGARSNGAWDELF